MTPTDRSPFTAAVNIVLLVAAVVVSAWLTAPPAATTSAADSSGYMTGITDTTVAGHPNPHATWRDGQPNIVLVTADDMRLDDLAVMPQTRRLLGDQGTAFTNAISAYPLCCPARATLLTGQLNQNNGVLGNRTEERGGDPALVDPDNNLGVWLQQQGYLTGFIGKTLNDYKDPPDWTMGDIRQDFDWHPFAADANHRKFYGGWDEAHVAYYKVSNYRHYGYSHETSGWVTREDSGQNGLRMHGQYKTRYEGQLLRNMINKMGQSGTPFFVHWSSFAPHVTDFGDDPPPHPDHAGYLPPADTYPDTDTPRMNHDRDIQSLHEARTAALQELDWQIQNLVGKLDRMGILDNTVIIFTSDNGYMLHEHGLFRKRWGYAESLDVPLLMRGPDVPVGGVREQAVALVDLPRTILSYATTGNIEPSDTNGRVLDGINLREHLNNPTVRWNRTIPIMANWPDDGWLYDGVRTRNWTYIEYARPDMTLVTDPVELFDLDNDPGQHNNLADTELDLTAEMASRVDELEGCVGTECQLGTEGTPGWDSPETHR